MSNSHFKKSSAVFECRHCGRRTRDTDGSNGSVQLCEDCNEGCMQENGMNDTDDEEVAAQYEKDMRECFQRAVNKGGVIEGYARTYPRTYPRTDGVNPAYCGLDDSTPIPF